MDSRVPRIDNQTRHPIYREHDGGVSCTGGGLNKANEGTYPAPPCTERCSWLWASWREPDPVRWTARTRLTATIGSLARLRANSGENSAALGPAS